MNHQQQIVPPRASANGIPCRNLDREGSGSHDSKPHLKNSLPGSSSNAVIGGKLGHANSSRDRLIYVMTQLIGCHVDVHVKNGSVISGILHATNTEKDFGIILKMAVLTKDGSVSGQGEVTRVAMKHQTMIIPARELVQILAKDIALAGDELQNGSVHDKRKDLMIDSAISCFYRPEERELERWTPDGGDSEFIELEKYDKSWNRRWDQFETNAALFGVQSTFSEDIYTTKLERGPHMRELEKQATRIAREIENEVTQDIHLAEERGLDLDEDVDQDEEIKYSAVRRDVDSSRFNLRADTPTTTCPFGSFIKVNQPSPHVLPTINSTNNASQPISEHQSHKVLPMDEESRLDKKLTKDDSGSKNNENLQSEKAFPQGGKPSMSEDLKNRPASSLAYQPSPSDQGNKYLHGLASDSVGSTKLSSASENLHTLQWTGVSTSLTSERVASNSISSTPGLSPSSSMGSWSSEKSNLNPNAKEFKFNPNAKSFTPSSPLRPPHSPASDNAPAVPLGPGLPMGAGFPSAFDGQLVVYNAQPGQLPSLQGYVHPSGPSQMMIGQGHPVYYYAPEMQQYRGGGF